MTALTSPALQAFPNASLCVLAVVVASANAVVASAATSMIPHIRMQSSSRPGVSHDRTDTVKPPLARHAVSCNGGHPPT